MYFYGTAVRVRTMASVCFVCVFDSIRVIGTRVLADSRLKGSRT
jgi:hypothetical protein